MSDDRPPAPPNGCQKYHGVPGCRCQVRATKDQPHPGAHHCNEHDRYWTDREEMYVSMYLSVATKWAALLEHADLAEDVQPEEVIDALSVRCNRRSEDHEVAAPPSDTAAPLDVERLALALRAWRGDYGAPLAADLPDAADLARCYAEAVPTPKPHTFDQYAALTPEADTPSEYGRLLAERDRLIASGVDPADLDLPDAPTADTP